MTVNISMHGTESRSEKPIILIHFRSFNPVLIWRWLSFPIKQSCYVYFLPHVSLKKIQCLINFCAFFLRAERKGREVVISIVFPSFDWLTSALDPKNGGQFQGHVWEHNKACCYFALLWIPLCDMPPKTVLACLSFWLLLVVAFAMPCSLGCRSE